MDRIVNNIQLVQKLTCMLRTKKKKKIQSNGLIFKICSHVNFCSESCNFKLQSSLYPNFIHNIILSDRKNFSSKPV